ncbi:hypothetical protein [Streptomyces sp. Alt3]|uniref:Uncharacterized protein n=1 Tax=Streptomyces glycanivorans TaxID=3033808 RepID=A0ABY9J7X5_9ACTN|nr:hypothetical protein [Streptomyces sp. Alt3]WLQ63079.1 hypothetical protein P8A20_05490 [Streptomyces sp. Alt3]
MRDLIARIPVARIRDAGLLEELLKLSGPAPAEAAAEQPMDIKSMGVADLVRAALNRSTPA